MARRHTGLALTLVAITLGACSKTGSPPNTFGVNLTVDATAVSAAERLKIAVGQLNVLSNKPGATVVTRTVEGFQSAVQGGIVRFHYTPGADVSAGDSLTFELDAYDVTKTTIIASGTSGLIKLAATAVPATISLTGSGGDGGVPSDGGGGDGNGKDIGVGCLTGGECASGFCADGVCCNEKCDDVCVSCNQSASKGMCTPYAMGTDPEMECTVKSAPSPADDAGATSDGAASDGAAVSSDGAAPMADAGADADDDGAAAESDATTINTPDGGFMTMPNACAGTCGGGRSCKYPDQKTACGTPFCNSRRDVALFVCDGNGGCDIALSSCTAYACDDAKGSCRTTCAAHIECLVDDYCSGGNTCLDKKANGIACATADECVSGNCSGPTGSSVCCSTACDGMGLTCTETSHVGQCQCEGVTCAAGVACQVFYQDADHDTYGNATGTIAAGTAKAGCAGSPPAGYVADNTDCDDGDANVNKGQTGYFGSPSKGIGTFDYNCDGSQEKATPEYVSGVCKFCGPTSNCAATTTTCAASGDTESFQCPEENLLITKLSAPDALGAGGGALVSRLEPIQPVQPVEPVEPIGPIQPIGRYCCGCRSGDKSGFVTTVACGASDYVYTCGSCSAAGGAASAETRVLTQQLCH